MAHNTTTRSARRASVRQQEETVEIPQIQTPREFDGDAARRVMKALTFSKVKFHGVPERHAGVDNAFLGYASVRVAAKGLDALAWIMPGLQIKLRTGKLRVEFPTRPVDITVDGKVEEKYLPIGFRPDTAEMRVALTGGVCLAIAEDIAASLLALKELEERGDDDKDDERSESASSEDEDGFSW